MNDPKNDNQNVQIKEFTALVAKNPGLLGRGLLFLMLFPFIFLSGFGAAGTYFLSRMEKDFYRTALPATATLTEKRMENYTETVQPMNNGPAQTVTKQRAVFDATFKTGDGTPVHARFSQGEQTLLREGDTVPIMYDPENPQSVKLASEQHTASFLSELSKTLGAAFLLLMALVFATARLSFRKVK